MLLQAIDNTLAVAHMDDSWLCTLWLSNLHIGYWTSLSNYNVLTSLSSSAQGFCSSTGWLAVVGGKLTVAVLLEKQRALRLGAPWVQCHGSTLAVCSPPPTLSTPVLSRTKLTQPREGQRPCKVWPSKASVVEKGFGVCFNAYWGQGLLPCCVTVWSQDQDPFQVLHLHKIYT